MTEQTTSEERLSESYAALEKALPARGYREVEAARERDRVEMQLALMHASPEWKDWCIAQLESQVAALEEEKRKFIARERACRSCGVYYRTDLPDCL